MGRARFMGILPPEYATGRRFRYSVVQASA